MRTIQLIIAYDGTAFCGWQRQENGPSIQAEIEKAVSLICNHQITVHGAGRTDAGVHALGMSAHFHTSSNVPCGNLLKGLNALLPRAIRIYEVHEKPADFHARFQAFGKQYRYSFFTGPVQSPTERLYTAHYPGDISLTALESSLKILIGTHDFSSFETAGSRDKTATNGRGPIRSIMQARYEQQNSLLFHLYFTGDGFLRHMVRNLAGTIIEVALGKRSVSEFSDILAARDRQRAGATAPARGLTLLWVAYEAETLSENLPKTMSPPDLPTR